MKQLTVRELARELMSLVYRGQGNKYLVAADDEEGNGYHGLFFGATSDPNDIQEIVKGVGIYDSVETDPTKIVIIG